AGDDDRELVHAFLPVAMSWMVRGSSFSPRRMAVSARLRMRWSLSAGGSSIWGLLGVRKPRHSWWRGCAGWRVIRSVFGVGEVVVLLMRAVAVTLAVAVLSSIPSHLGDDPRPFGFCFGG